MEKIPNFLSGLPLLPHRLPYQPQLCQTCSNCLSLNNANAWYSAVKDPLSLIFEHHATPENLKGAAATGCIICKPLLDVYNVVESKLRSPETRGPMTTRLIFQPTKLYPRVECKWKFLLLAQVHKDAFNLPGVNSPPCVLFLIQEPEGFVQHFNTDTKSFSTISDESWSLARQWLDSCLSDHSRCAQPQEGLWDHTQDSGDEPWYPTRLLDVGPSHESLIRLVIPAETTNDTLGSYVTVSQRRGTTKNKFLLTQENISQWREGVDVNLLPLSYQHAIQVVRRLGKRYVWIDSLCVLQDSEDSQDWKKEASMIPKIYAHTFLNLAATHIRDSNEGWFASRIPITELAPCRFDPSPLLTETYDIPEDQTLVLTPGDFYNSHLATSDLYQKLWALQQRHFSRRSLYFGATQLLWGCRECVRSETFPHTTPTSTLNSHEQYLKSGDLNYIRRSHSNTPDMYMVWARWVNAFQNTYISNPADKPLAIGAIARRLGSRFDDTYIAGLWRKRIVPDLAWHISEARQANFTASSRDFAYRAPTWSWISVDGVTICRFFDAYTTALLTEVLDVSMEYKDDNPYGQILDGHLKLRGRLRCVQIKTKLMEYAMLNESGDINVTTYPIPDAQMIVLNGKQLEPSCEPLAADSDEVAQLEYGMRKGALIVCMDVPFTGMDDECERSELFMVSLLGPMSKPQAWLPISLQNVVKYIYQGQDRNSLAMHHMLLLKCVDKEKAIFNRIGIAFFDTVSFPEVEEMVNAYDPDEADLPCLEYDAEKHSHVFILK